MHLTCSPGEVARRMSYPDPSPDFRHGRETLQDEQGQFCLYFFA